MTHTQFFVALLAIAGCQGATADPGLGGALRVSRAQYASGALPAPANGPAFIALRVPHAQLLPGLRRELLSGSLPPDATAVLLGLAGDPGHWIIAAGAPSIDEPDYPTFSAELVFARDLTDDPIELQLSAVRGDGTVGPRRVVMLEALHRARSDQLSIELRWDTRADLDLHVTLPDGVELGPANIHSYAAPPPGSPASYPNGSRTGGVLDRDANADCATGGPREERAQWALPPPSGPYAVRIATASLCGEHTAHWTLEVWLGGALRHVVHGSSQPWDTRAGSGLGSGALALTFSVP